MPLISKRPDWYQLLFTTRAYSLRGKFLLGLNCCNQAWVLKKSVIGMLLLAAIIAAIEFFPSPQLSGSFHGRCCRLAEEPH